MRPVLEQVNRVYHRLDRRIRAHVTLCTFAYLLERLVEIEAKTPFDDVRSLLRRVRAVALTFEEQTVWETNALTPEVKHLLAAMKIPAPPRMVAGPA